jgi:hypothetical protein
MPNSIHDPYLNTVKRNLKDKYYKNKKATIEKSTQKKRGSKSFLSQEIHLSDHLNLSENTTNTLLFSAFLLLPYIIGILFIFLIIARANLSTFQEIHINQYFIYWAIGYEVLASILMLVIIKSAIGFKK